MSQETVVLTLIGLFLAAGLIYFVFFFDPFKWVNWTEKNKEHKCKCSLKKEK